MRVAGSAAGAVAGLSGASALPSPTAPEARVGPPASGRKRSPWSPPPMVPSAVSGVQGARLSIGRERVRQLLAGLGFGTRVRRKNPRRATPAVTGEDRTCRRGAGARSMQRRLSSLYGFAWVHVVGTRLTSVSERPVSADLSKSGSAHTLHEGHHSLVGSMGSPTSLVIQKRCGLSDSTSEYFQRGCQVHGRG